ncbi:MAG TPA: beta-1,6-N-acetylglucosaminyltransferase [Thermoanaerobaculia bacterium]|jgi:hypothetical protein
MRIAFLILAHHQPAHLARLVRILNRDWARIFIHIDRKVDIADFQRLAPEDGNIRFLGEDQRTKVSWGGFSQVAATLNLLGAALSSGEAFTRFCLLSGSDFPIKGMEHIRAALDTEKEFIRVDRRIGALDANLHCKNVRYFYFTDVPLLKRSRLSGLMPRRCYTKINLYHGAQWWSLTGDCVKYIMDFIRSNRDYVCFHRWTLVPDEIFFHSIVKQSPFASNITHDFETAPSYSEYMSLNEHGCTYIDWNAKGVPLPKVLTLDDYDSLMDSRCLFARKFDERRSSSLLERLEKKISAPTSSY